MDIKSCYIGPKISPEQFIPEHFFLYVLKGTIHGYDGNAAITLHEGEYCIARKNHLARYNKVTNDGQFEKIVIAFDEDFLRKFEQSHKVEKRDFPSEDAFAKLQDSPKVHEFAASLMPHYQGSGIIDPNVADQKREELLTLLLELRPDSSGIFFDYAMPEKIDLEAFMNKNYRFNVSLERLATATGRSLSAFKRDFRNTFHEAPYRWLLQKRLREAHFLIAKEHKKPSEFYLDLGFENLSHFSFAFKKRFGQSPKKLFETGK